MTDFCVLALTIMVCLLIAVIIWEAFGIPQIFERIADALELKNEQDIRPKVYSDWYERLSHLEYNYHPHYDGEAWYKADDVWNCIERKND